MRYTPGRGSNNKVELTTLRTLLFIAQDKGTKKPQVFGDSKLAIDWACSRVNITTVSLIPLLNDLKHHMSLFEWLSFQHIYKELNTVANKLSKEGVQLPKAAFRYYEYVDGEETQSMEFRL